MTGRPAIYGAILVSIALLWAAAATACTTFVLRDGDRAVFGKNLDWFADPGLVMVNQRGLAKEAMAQPDAEPLRWVSEYGSVTFNQAGRELPMGGMNEAGLVVESMWLDTTEYPEPDGRSRLVEAQWAQYQLDNHATVEEVIAGDSLVTISHGSVPLHFLILDGAGDIAVVEFLKGKMVSYAGDNVPFEVLTNSNYRESAGCFMRGGLTGGNTSLQRFVDATAMTRAFEGGKGDAIIDYSFHILEEVAAEVTPVHFTRWSIVYDFAGGRIYFRTHDSPSVKYIDTGDLDFACGSRRVAIDIHTKGPGRVNERMVDYTAELNRELVLETFKIYRAHDFLDLSTADLIDLYSYPEGFICTEE
jgi:penicillin V acylase-like amidase (Ntn superfamily)